MLTATADRLARLSPRRRWQYSLGAIALLLIFRLLAAEKPWNVEPAERPKLRDVITIWTWWATAAGAVVAGSLAAIAPWWAGQRILATNPSRTPTPPWFWWTVAAAMAVTAFFSQARLGFSLWDDEELCVRHSLAGRFRTDKSTGEPKFLPLRWEETFFDYRTPNNHVLHSVFSRASNEAWQALARPNGLPFSEIALRLPAFIFGILAVAALAWFLKDLGRPGAGAVAAWLLAVHPWQIRYASEARGYSLVLLLVPLVFTFWLRAVREGKWRWWAAFAAAQFALLYTYPGMLFLLLVLNALTLPVLAFSSQAAQPFRAQSGRWFCVNSLSAIPALLLMLPLVPQARAYFEEEGARKILLGWPWVRSALSHLFAGVPWSNNNAAAALGAFASDFPAASFAFLAAGAVLFVWGALQLARRGAPETVLLAAMLLAPALTFLVSRWRQMLVYESYVLFALPGLLALLALGVAGAAGLLGKLPPRRALAPAFSVACVAAFFLGTQGFRQALVTRPLQQIRESVLATRPTLSPHAPGQEDILTASFCIPPYLYDAWMVRVDSADELIALLLRADREKKPLHLNIGMPWAARQYSPKMWALLHESALFGNFQTLPGFDAGLDRIVAQYVPGSARDFDFSAYAGGER